MNKILNKKLSMVTMLVVITVSAFFTINVDAKTILENANLSTINMVEEKESLSSNSVENNTIISNATLNTQGSGSLYKAENYMNEKLGDVVKFLQSFIKPFTYIAFILSAISIIIGMIAGSKHKFAGIIGMALSILVYMCVSFGPEIVEYFAAWLAM